MIQHELRGARFTFHHGAEIWIDDASGRCVLIPPPGSKRRPRRCTVEQLYRALMFEAYRRGLVDADELRKEI